MVSSVKVIKAISEPGGPMVRVRGGAPPGWGSYPSYRLNREPHITHLHGELGSWSNVWKLRSMGGGRAMVLSIP